MKTLTGKTIVITGAASGIGRALARRLARKGAVLALVDKDEPGLIDLCDELAETGCVVSSHVVDVSCRTSMEQLPLAVLSEHKAVDVLINNAGVSVGAMFDDHTIGDAEWLLGINLMGVVYGCKFFLPYLKQSPEAHIVNVSSMFGLFSMPGQAIYSASKAGVRALSEALWTELGGTTVRVTTVHPGTIRSNVIRSSRMLDAQAQEKAVTLQHKYGMPTDKAAAKIVNAIERNKLRVVVGADAHVAELLKRLFPVSFQRFIGIFFR